jgi:hypothetical protein
LELSLQAMKHIRQERERLHRHWQQRLERAGQEARRAERQYQAVEPENRLMARSLEQRWEVALRAQQALQEEYDRFLQEQPRTLSADERARVTVLAKDIPALWRAPQTTAAERKETVRLLVERVVVRVQADSERAEVEIAWRGGMTTRHVIVRSVSRYESLGDYPRLLERIGQLRREGLMIKEVASQLNQEGYRTPRSRKGYTSTSVRKLLSRYRQKTPHEKTTGGMSKRNEDIMSRHSVIPAQRGSCTDMHLLASAVARVLREACDKGGIMARRSGSVGAPGSNPWRDPALGLTSLGRAVEGEGL